MSYRTTSTTQSGHVTTRAARTNSRFSRNYSGLLASLGFASFLFTSASALAVPAPPLGAAQSFAILGGQAVTATAPVITINGNVGIAPLADTFITGFAANVIMTPPFTNHGGDSVALAARAATTTLLTSSELAPTGGTPITPDLSIGGPSADGIYTPGKYSLASGIATIPTTMTLDGAGVYIFSLYTAITTSVGSTIILTNGADPCNVFWLVPTLATLNGVNFPGTVVAGAGVHLGTSSSLTGRALSAAGGDVTMAGDNFVGGCSAAAPPPPGGISLSSKTFSPTTIAAGGVSTLTITLSNSNLTASTLIAPLIDTLPSGMVIAPTPNASTTCNVGVGLGGGVVTANAGESTVTLSTESVIPGGEPGSCTVKVDVTAVRLCSFTNTLSAGALVTSFGNNPVEASATLTIPSLCGLVPPPPAAATAIPTLSEWAMIVLAAFMAITGFVAMRRKER